MKPEKTSADKAGGNVIVNNTLSSRNAAGGGVNAFTAPIFL